MVKVHAPHLRKYLAEFISTFILVFCGTGAIVIDQQTNGSVSHVGVAVTFGLVVAAMIYSFGEVSGSHMNPAVSISFALLRKLEGRLLLPYIVSQLAGAIAASLILKILFPANIHLGGTLPAGTDGQSFILEFILTFILMLVVIMTTTSSPQVLQLAGIIIGGVVLFEAMFAGPICGASMNPARSIGPAVVSMNFRSLWVYIVAPVTGALTASLLWNYLIKHNTHDQLLRDNSERL